MELFVIVIFAFFSQDMGTGKKNAVSFQDLLIDFATYNLNLINIKLLTE